jgi:hypothetical protein
MKKKNLISLSVAFAFLALSITGILLFVKQKAHAVEITHTIFGLTFVGFAIFHIVNNWSSITGYSKERTGGSFKKEFIYAGVAFLLLLAGTVSEVLEPLAEAGRVFAPKRERKQELRFEVIELNKDQPGQAVELMIQKDKDAEMPVVAAWIEDSAHHFVESIFVPGQIAGPAENEEEAREGHFEMSQFNAAILPTFNTNASVKTSNFEKETPHNDFVLKTHTKASGTIYVMLEAADKGKTALYEAKITTTAGVVAGLQNKGSANILKGIVSVN